MGTPRPRPVARGTMRAGPSRPSVDSPTRSQVGCPILASDGLEGEDDMDFADGQLLRPAEVIDLLGVSRSWLYDAAKAGRIPCVRLGGPDGPVRFRARELQAWIEGSRIDPSESRPLAQTHSAPERGRRDTASDEETQLRLPS